MTDLIDFLEPTMVIVGSRGLGKLKGILLGSTSHYLVQKSSVPVMVGRLSTGEVWIADFQ
jgi:nucleotide-binding universal stress UspA family protein